MTSPTPTGDAATILAAHQRDSYAPWGDGQGWHDRCICGTTVDASTDGGLLYAHAAHQAAVLAESGYGQVSALLTDLRALAADWAGSLDPNPEVGPAHYLLAVIDRHTPTTRQEPA